MLSIIIVGINGWEEYTRPLIAGIWTHHPDMELCVIDNASDTPYPKGDHIHRLDKRVSYAEAINYGIDHTHGQWILVLNNDVRCDGAFESLIKELDPNTIYGMTVYSEPTFNWLSSWIFLVHRTAAFIVGEFDPRFKICAYEDVDYCYRAKQHGIDTKPFKLPFYHYDGKTRWDIDGYESVRLENRMRFEEKHSIKLHTRPYDG